MIEYGPSVPDIGLLPSSANLSYTRFDYNEYKIEKIIDKFLNNPKRVITQAEVVQSNALIETILESVNNKFFRTFYEDEDISTSGDFDE